MVISISISISIFIVMINVFCIYNITTNIIFDNRLYSIYCNIHIYTYKIVKSKLLRHGKEGGKVREGDDGYNLGYKLFKSVLINTLERRKICICST